MQVAFEIPDDLGAQLTAAGKDPSCTAPELLAVESYRSGGLSEGQIKQMLGYSTRMKVHALLAEHGISLHYAPEDLEVDAETSEFIRSQSASELSVNS